MTTLQRLALRWLPRQWAEALEAEPRAWVAQCWCGHEVPARGSGGVRRLATGDPRRLMACPICGKSTWHTLHLRTPGGSQPDRH